MKTAPQQVFSDRGLDLFPSPDQSGLLRSGRMNTEQFSLLPAGRTVSVSHRTPLTVRCLSGRIWVTSSGRPGDHILKPGETLHIPGAGKTIAVSGADGSSVRFNRV